MKLNIGGGDWEDFNGVDRRKGLNYTYKMNLAEDSLVDKFGKGTCGSIMTAHFLEHMSLKNAYRILEECYELLKLGGWLYIQVPDALYKKHSIRYQVARCNHFALYTDRLLILFLLEVKFKKVEPMIEKTFSYFERRWDCSLSLRAQK